MNSKQSSALTRCCGWWTQRNFLVCLVAVVFAGQIQAQIFNNLQALGTRLPVGDPRMPGQHEGPKGLATADLDNDGRPDVAVANLDGTVTVYFSLSGGRFSAPTHLRALPPNTLPAGIGGGVPPLPVPPERITNELRGIICADLSGDGLIDIATAAPYTGQIYVFLNQGLRVFSAVTNIAAWPGARNLAAGDFDGDGITDFVVAGTTNGLRQYKGTGAGEFVIATNITALATTLDPDDDSDDFPRPLFAMDVYRLPGTTRDQIAVTHVESRTIWLLAANTNGALEIIDTVANQAIHSLMVGAITQPAAAGVFDLVTASRDHNVVEVHQGKEGGGFKAEVAQQLSIPGGPRAIAITDLDADGWNDLVVVVRNFDRLIAFHNSNGTLIASSEIPVGRSPRELVSADFNQDGFPDMAVINRDSQDLSVVNTFPGAGSFVSSDQVYPIEGEAAGLAVQDFNGDGRDDVIQLHRGSGEVSVRLAEPNGHLGPPTYYPLGNRPEAQVLADANNDGNVDIIAADLGGSISVRLGDGNGGFGTQTNFPLPPDALGALFALVAADFNGDGSVDLAAGYFDCRLAFFQGHGDGTFSFMHTHRFVYESRVMAAGDFDGDGDIDLAGAGWAGDFVVVENRGDLLTTSQLTRTDTKNNRMSGARSLKVTEENGDHDPDLIVGTDSGLVLYLGGPGLSFTEASATNTFPNVNFSVSGLAYGDFDSDGKIDLATSCQLLSCLIISTRDETGTYLPSLIVDVPSGRFLATGDLDGDGKVDLVGSGTVLWTALSGHASTQVAAAPNQNIVRTTAVPVINEIMAANTSLGLSQDGNRNSDWVELFNGTGAGLSLGGWRLRLEASNGSGGAGNNDFVFPATAFFGHGAHLVVVCSDVRRTPYHTGFKLPSEGGTLVLLDPQGVEVNRVTYPPQMENISYSRYRDGGAAMGFNSFPDPGGANVDNGPLEPTLKLEGVDAASLQPGQPVRFFARGSDDAGIVSVSIVYRRMDISDPEPHRIYLYDDGLNQDGATLDGLFSGTLDVPLPDGAEIQFYVEVIDLSDKTIILPSEPLFAAEGQASSLYTLAVGGHPVPIQISELVAFNTHGLTDERGTNSDWVEIRNTSASPVSLAGVTLAQNLFGTKNRYTFPADKILGPNQHVVIFCDDSTSVGPAHAPFRLGRGGDDLILTGVGENGARMLLDSVTFGAQTNDIAYGRLGRNGPWRKLTPTPRALNIPGPYLTLIDRAARIFTFAYPTVPGESYTVEYSDSLSAPRWTALPTVTGDGLEQAIDQLLISKRFFRVRVGSESSN